VQRRWVENTLPDYELLDAVAIAYGRVAELVHDAHRQAGLPPTDTTDTSTGEVYGEELRAGRLPCMIGHAERRSIDVSLATGEPVEFETVTKTVSVKEAREKAPGLEERYGVPPGEVYGHGETAEDRARAIFETARAMFLKDGYHVTVAFLLRATMPVRITELRFRDQADKYLLMRKMADDVVKTGADAVVIVGEVWAAKADYAKPYMRAADAPDRQELLAATLVSRDGEPLHLAARIVRAGDKVQLEASTEDRGGSHFQFAPIYAAWGKPVPEAWKDVSPVAHADRTRH
jgi:hypothetical protein